MIKIKEYYKPIGIGAFGCNSKAQALQDVANTVCVELGIREGKQRWRMLDDKTLKEYLATQIVELIRENAELKAQLKKAAEDTNAAKQVEMILPTKRRSFPSPK